MRYLVLGGSGFIGSHLAEHLLTRGDQVTIFDLTDGPKTTATFVPGDIRDRDLLAAVVRQHDAVFHLAAVVGFARVMAEPVRTITTCIEGTANVFALCADFRKRVLFTSTSAIYGRTVDDQRPVQETDACKLGSPAVRSWCYAYAKGVDECLAHAYHGEQGLPVIVTRLFNTVGPRQSADAGFVLPRFVHAALDNAPLYVHEPGSQTRTFCHVQDVVEGLAQLMECDHAIGETVNLGGTATISMHGLAQRVVTLTESRSPIVTVPDPYGTGYENVQHRTPSLSTAHRLIGYQPRRGLDEMITDVALEYEGAKA